MRIPFFLSLSVPLPRSILRAAEFIRDSNPEQVALFWDTHLRRLDGLLEASRDTQSAWTLLVPVQTAPAAGKLQLPALMALADQCGIGGSVWLQQFLFGFPLIGRLAQPRFYPTELKDARKRAEPVSKSLKTTASRFADRAKKSGFGNAKALWGEALEQCDKGRLNRPFPLCTERAHMCSLIRSLTLLSALAWSKAQSLELAMICGIPAPVFPALSKPLLILLVGTTSRSFQTSLTTSRGIGNSSKLIMKPHINSFRWIIPMRSLRWWLCALRATINGTASSAAP